VSAHRFMIECAGYITWQPIDSCIHSIPVRYVVLIARTCSFHALSSKVFQECQTCRPDLSTWSRNFHGSFRLLFLRIVLSVHLNGPSGGPSRHGPSALQPAAVYHLCLYLRPVGEGFGFRWMPEELMHLYRGRQHSACAMG